MKILLLGGTGAMGKHLSNLLNTSTNNVYITSRSVRPSSGNIQYIKGNAHDVQFLEETLNINSWDVVVDFMIYTTQEFQDRVRLLLSSCKQYVFLSSSRVYADTQPFITEGSPRLLDVTTNQEYVSTDEYALSKAREENVLFESGLNNYTIIRPYITYSEQRLQLGVYEKEGWLYRALHGRTIVFSEDIASKYTTLTYGLDVAKGMVALFGKQDALGRAFHITTDKSIKWSDILNIYIEAIAEYTGIKPKVLMIPKNNRLVFRKTASIWQVIYDRYYNRRFDNSSIKEFIDNSTFKSQEHGLKECIHAFIEDERYSASLINWKLEAYHDKLTHEHTSLLEIPTYKQKVKYLIYRYLLPKSKF